jgi:hypothetical protein
MIIQAYRTIESSFQAAHTAPSAKHDVDSSTRIPSDHIRIPHKNYL